jgi:hypothetical protein
VTPIRPAGPPSLQPAQPQRADPARLAAQRAFFELAAGKAQAPAASAARASPAPVQRMAAAPAEPPAKLLRPGSLLNIRV